MSSKGDRWARQMLRADLVSYLLRCYEPFYMIKMQSECIKHTPNYADAEKMSNFVSSVFNMDCSVADMMPDKDDLSNSIIDNYEALKELLSYCDYFKYDYSKEDVMSFMEYEYHNNSWLKMKFLEYSGFSTWVLLAARRTFPISFIRKKCVEYRIWDGGSVKCVDSRMFRKTFIRIEKDFFEIVEKRKNRINRNNKKS